RRLAAQRPAALQQTRRPPARTFHQHRPRLPRPYQHATRGGVPDLPHRRRTTAFTERTGERTAPGAVLDQTVEKAGSLGREVFQDGTEWSRAFLAPLMPTNICRSLPAGDQ